MDISDFQINSRVRSVLARNWVDLHKIAFGSFRGTVRFSGEICYLGGRSSDKADPHKVELLERELMGIEGVRRIYFDLSNWHRTDAGQWIAKRAGTPAVLAAQQDDAKPKVLVFKAIPKTAPDSGAPREVGKESHERSSLP